MIELKKTIDIGYDDGHPVRFLSGALFTIIEPITIEGTTYLFVAPKSLAPMVVESKSDKDYKEFLLELEGEQESYFWTPYAKIQIPEIRNIHLLGKTVLINNSVQIYKHSDKSAYFVAEALKIIQKRLLTNSEILL